ncbi:MAG: 50S ribosomal protein L10 [bacterium]
MAKEEKIKFIEELGGEIGRASAVYFMDFTGVRANDFNDLRRVARERRFLVKVVKNRLALRALRQCGVPSEIFDVLKGPTSLILTNDDPVAPARLLKEMASRIAGVRFKGAYFGKNIFLADQFDFLAGLPTKEELRGQVVWVLIGPLAGLVGVCGGLLGELVWVLDEITRRPKAEGN